MLFSVPIYIDVIVVREEDGQRDLPFPPASFFATRLSWELTPLHSVLAFCLK